MTTDFSSAYLEKLAQFTGALREGGISSGIAETMDAVRVAELVGLRDRMELRRALRTVLAKSEREQQIFDEIFERFFVSSTVQEQRESRKAEETEKQEAQYREAREELKYEGKPLELKEEVKAAYSRLPAAEREQLMKYLEFATGNMRKSPFNERFMQRMIEQRLLLDDTDETGEAPAITIEAGSELMYRNISEISESEMPKVIALIKTLAKRVDGVITRKYRRTGKSGRLDFRRTIHHGLRTGGVFFTVAHKRRRKTKKRIILLCDVSGSMLKFSQFALSFIKSMSALPDKSDTFLFSEGVCKLNPFDFHSNFEQTVRDSELWAKGTDIGTALTELAASPDISLSERSLLLVLSDTKTINLKAAVAELEKLSKRVSRIIWLNPIPEARWQNMKSVSAFRNSCLMLDCSTLDNLSTACTRLASFI